jgi:hypothetical protein
MAALGKKLRTQEGERLAFWCPGCNEAHAITTAPGRWSFNGDADRPTFSPSILVRSGHYALDRPPGNCWCDFAARYPGDGPVPFKCERCHSFVTDGQIQFLDDCTHELAGQTVPLPDFP